MIIFLYRDDYGALLNNCPRKLFSKRIGNIINLIAKALNELGYSYNILKSLSLYSRTTGEKYPINSLLYNTDIRNGAELVIL